MDTLNSYDAVFPGLAETVAACAPKPGHKALVQALRRLSGLEAIKLVATRGRADGICVAKRGIYDATGAQLHDDHKAWLRLQVDADGGNALATHERLVGRGFRLSSTELTILHLAIDHGGDQSNFSNVELWLEHERLDCELLRAWIRPRDVSDLVGNADGYALPDDQRTLVRPAQYALKRATHVDRFVRAMEANDAENLRAAGLGMVDAWPCRGRRLFEDWAASSAGRSGARFCDYWFVECVDWTDPNTCARQMELRLGSTCTKRLAKVDAESGDAQAFFGKLQALDRRSGHRFGWYFHMLRGDCVRFASGYRALKEVERGAVALPEPDRQVLKAWGDRNYGF